MVFLNQKMEFVVPEHCTLADYKIVAQMRDLSVKGLPVLNDRVEDNPCVKNVMDRLFLQRKIATFDQILRKFAHLANDGNHLLPMECN